MKNKPADRPLFPFVLVAGNVEGLQARHRRGGYPVYLAVVLSLVAAVLALPFVTVAVSSQSRGVLRPAHERTPLTSAVGGRLLEVNLPDNGRVCAGDVLAVVSSGELTPEIEALGKQLTEQQYLLADLEQLTAEDQADYPTLASAVYQRDYQSYRQRLEEARLKTAHAERHHARQQSLVATQTIARAEYEQAAFELELARRQQATLRDQQLRLWAQEKDRLGRERRDLRSRLTTLRRRAANHVITAQLDGTLTQVAGLQPGGFVAPGQQLAVISPDGALHVDLFVDPADIGLLRPDMNTTLQFDAFHHHRWGMARGRIADIARDVTEADGRPVFRVRCELLDDQLTLKNGYVGRLKKGMTLTAHFTLTERTLFQLLHDKLDDWLNPNGQS